MERRTLLGVALLAACGLAGYLGASLAGGESRATQERTMDLLERLDVQSRAAAADLEELRRSLDRGPTRQPEPGDAVIAPAERVALPDPPAVTADGDGVETTLGELAAHAARIEAALDPRTQPVIRPGEQHPRNTTALESVPKDAEGLASLRHEMLGWAPANVYRRYGLPDYVNAGDPLVIWDYYLEDRTLHFDFSVGVLENIRSITKP